MFSIDGNFCCEKMRTIIHEWITTDECLPILRSSESHYNFVNRRIDYCPFCGSLIIDQIRPDCESENKSLCCGTMEYFCNIPDIIDDWVEFGIFYDTFSRRYYFSTHKDFWGYEGVDYKQWDIFYCIFCGAKLPESLLELWLETVTKEFGVVQLERSEKMLPFVPEEYRTDLWWKKRGL